MGEVCCSVLIMPVVVVLVSASLGGLIGTVAAVVPGVVEASSVDVEVDNMVVSDPIEVGDWVVDRSFVLIGSTVVIKSNVVVVAGEELIVCVDVVKCSVVSSSVVLCVFDVVVAPSSVVRVALEFVVVGCTVVLFTSSVATISSVVVIGTDVVSVDVGMKDECTTELLFSIIDTVDCRCSVAVLFVATISVTLLKVVASTALELVTVLSSVVSVAAVITIAVVKFESSVDVELRLREMLSCVVAIVC